MELRSGNGFDALPSSSLKSKMEKKVESTKANLDSLNFLSWYLNNSCSPISFTLTALTTSGSLLAENEQGTRRAFPYLRTGA